jgi:hypothetical protein
MLQKHEKIGYREDIFGGDQGKCCNHADDKQSKIKPKRINTRELTWKNIPPKRT